MRELGVNPVGPEPMRMLVYRELFDRIIERDRVFGGLLARIKAEYEMERVEEGLSGGDECVFRYYLLVNRHASAYWQSFVYCLVCSSCTLSCFWTTRA